MRRCRTAHQTAGLGQPRSRGDPNYNGVVFHGALEVKSAETRLQSGSHAPVVSLQALLEEEPEKISDGETSLDLWEVLCRKGYARPGSIDEAGAALDRAGDQRFLLKSQQLSEFIRADGPDQALYHAMMEGLGYSSNRRPFTELASRAPYEAIAQAALEIPSRDRALAIRGWLGSCSGFDSPEQPRPRGIGPAMNRQEWRLFRVRPANHPRRRIWGAALAWPGSWNRGWRSGSGLEPRQIDAGAEHFRHRRARFHRPRPGPGPGGQRRLALHIRLASSRGPSRTRRIGPLPRLSSPLWQ